MIAIRDDKSNAILCLCEQCEVAWCPCEFAVLAVTRTSLKASNLLKWTKGGELEKQRRCSPMEWRGIAFVSMHLCNHAPMPMSEMLFAP